MIHLEAWFENIYTEISERLVIDGFNIFLLGNIRA